VQLSRLSGRKVNDYVLKKGKVWRGKTMMIRWLPGPPKNPNVDPAQRALYVGTAASKKLHKSAVKRNRMRRRCREALRTAVKEANGISTVQLLVSPRSSSLTCDFTDIKSDVCSFLSIITHG